MLENIFTLFMLIMLQAVLGFDNLLYISLESKKAPETDRKRVRKAGILIAIVLRIVLLFLLVSIIGYFQKPFSFLTGGFEGVIKFAFNGHSIIVLLGGGFIIYTAIKEIWHMIGTQNLEQSAADQRKGTKSSKTVIFSIVLMNLVFSFDSILAAIALTDVFVLMIIAILAGGLIMIKLSDGVTEFLKKNRMFEVLGLFILFLVGVMLLSEGAHLAHMSLFENEILPMSKATFYFILFVLVLIDIIQNRYQKILNKK